MLKLIQLLKKSILSIIIVLVLLIIEAQCDLALPEYISNIVNIGIQQSGIKNITPDEIRQTEMEKLFLFMTDEDKNLVLENYEKKNGSINGISTYVFKGSLKTVEDLDKVFAIPMASVLWLSGESSDTEHIKDSLSEFLSDEEIPENADIFELLAGLPDEQRLETVRIIKSRFENAEPRVLAQMGIIYLQQEYQALNIDIKKLQSNYILNAGMKMLMLSLLIAVTTVLISFMSSKIAASYGRDIRSSMFKKVIGFSNKEFNKFSTASLITRTTNDIQHVQMLLGMLMRVVVYAPIIGLGALYKVFRTISSMTWLIGVAVFCLLVLIVLLFSIATPKFKLLQRLIDKLNLVSREILTGLPVIRAFSREKYEEERFNKANTDLMKTNLFVNRVMTIMMPAMMLIMNGISLLIIWVGAGAIESGDIQVGDLMAFIQYAMQVIMSFLMLSMTSVSLPRAAISAKRISEVLNTETSIKDAENPVAVLDVKGRIEFLDVYFKYPNAEEDVLKNISFVADPGKTTAIIGSTGSGKSTLLNLMLRFYDPTKGKIMIDNIDIKDISLHDLRKIIGYVPQRSILFSGSIESNIGYGESGVTHSDIAKAAEIAQASEFINEKNRKYKSEISQGGTNVSGGQRQRLSIARAIAKNPRIYLFDDSFSALDYKTDANLRKALHENTKDCTIIIVAQRISTVLNADQIIVLNDTGEIAGIGKHRELLASCEVYRQIALSQLPKEELEA